MRLLVARWRVRVHIRWAVSHLVRVVVGGPNHLFSMLGLLKVFIDLLVLPLSGFILLACLTLLHLLLPAAFESVEEIL